MRFNNGSLNTGPVTYNAPVNFTFNFQPPVYQPPVYQQQQQPKLKFCSTCKQSKPKQDYYKRKESRDGLQAKCKDCCRKVNEARYHGFKPSTTKDLETKEVKEKIKRTPAEETRLRLSQALNKKGLKEQEVIYRIGCSRFYLNSWLNYTKEIFCAPIPEMELDHFIPIKSFNLNEERQIRQANH